MKQEIKLSVSSIDTFKSCAKKYYYRYIEKLKVDSKKWNFTEFGSCAHLMLEKFHIRVNHETPIEDYAKIMKECYVESIQSDEFDSQLVDGDFF